MRNMSFMLTTEQIKNRSKTMTRRLGWKFLKPGDRIQACEKCMGLKKGEKINKLAVIEVVEVWREPLFCITEEDCTMEGFPELSPNQFIKMFRKVMNCCYTDPVTVIKFKYVD